MRSRIEGEWTGWDGSTVVTLVNGSVWQQDEYYYRYQYKYRPEVIVDGNRMHVDGMPKAIRVRRLRYGIRALAAVRGRACLRGVRACNSHPNWAATRAASGSTLDDTE